jgi:hypothetical protein
MLNSLIGIIASSAKGFLPSDLSGLKAWYDAADTATISVSGNAVTQWNDKSTSGYNITQGTAANRPTSGLSTQNGKNIITADGGDFLSNSTASNWKFMNDGTVYLVCAAVKFGTSSNPNALMTLLDNTKLSAANEGVGIFYDDRTAIPRQDQMFQYLPGLTDSLNTFNLTASDFMPANTFSVFTMTADPGNLTAANRSYLYNNTSGATQNNAETAGADTTDPTFGMTFLSDGSGTFGLLGSIAEIVIVAGADATDANRIKIRDYLKSKWAI